MDTITTNGAIKLYRLEIEDVFGVKSVQMQLDGQSAMLIGANEAGKTSIIDAIMLAMGQHKDGDPRRRGERKGEIYADFGKFSVSRIWKEKGAPKWEVKAKEGDKFDTAKDFFDGFIDSITVKPDAILKMGGADRAKAVCKAVNIDMDEHTAKRKAVYDERTAIGRMRKEAEAKMIGMGRPDANIPDTELSISDLNTELAELRKADRERENIELDLQAIDREIESTSQEVLRKTEELKAIQKQLESLSAKRQSQDTRREETIRRLDSTPSKNYEIEAVHQKLAKAESINNEIRKKARYNEAKAEFAKFDEEYSNKSLEIENIDNGLRERLNDAGLVEGLVVEEDDIYLNNLPFSRLSKFQQLDLAMRIGMHIKSANKNGETINILCMDASQYDEDNWNELVAVAKEQGYSVIIEIARRLHRNGDGKLNVPDDIKNVKDVKKFYIEEGTAEELVEA